MNFSEARAKIESLTIHSEIDQCRKQCGGVNAYRLLHIGHGCCLCRVSSISQTNDERSTNAILLIDSLRLSCSPKRNGIGGHITCEAEHFLHVAFRCRHSVNNVGAIVNRYREVTLQEDGTHGCLHLGSYDDRWLKCKLRDSS